MGRASLFDGGILGTGCGEVWEEGTQVSASIPLLTLPPSTPGCVNWMQPALGVSAGAIPEPLSSVSAHPPSGTWIRLPEPPNERELFPEAANSYP